MKVTIVTCTLVASLIGLSNLEGETILLESSKERKETQALMRIKVKTCIKINLRKIIEFKCEMQNNRNKV